ncbi:DUF2156 domain-containing protein [Turicimonas muris]|uniref:DUF2156 domain-containing protein n=1 Tax=Turicimonas muris TaxID=1796652 RepID=UPI00402AFC7F
MSIELKPVTIDTLPLLKEHIGSLQDGDCNLALVSIIGRSAEYKIQYAEVEGEIVLNWQPYPECPAAYVVPWNSPKIANILPQLECQCKNCKEPLLLFGRFTEMTEHVQKLFRYRNFITVSSNSWWDYLYAKERFLTLEGRQLNGKRNFNKRFNKAYPNAEFIPLNPSTIPMARAFLEKWYKSRGDMDEGLIAERDAINLAFEHWDDFELIGGILKEGDSVFGFTYGSGVYEDIFAVHIEKADRNIVGAYPALAVALAKMLPEKYKVLNREEDLGVPGLRKAKEDWFPCGVVRKTVLKLQKDNSIPDIKS